jgi:hypothetical protein
LEKNDNTIPANTEKKKAPILIRVVSFFVGLGATIGILFYGFLFIFNSELITEKISIISNPFINTYTYVIIELILFIILIIGAFLLSRLKRSGIILIITVLSLLLTMNYFYYGQFDWFNIGVTITIMLILGIKAKKFN